MVETVSGRNNDSAVVTIVLHADIAADSVVATVEFVVVVGTVDLHTADIVAGVVRKHLVDRGHRRRCTGL